MTTRDEMVAELVDILTEDWQALCGLGDKVDGETGTFETIALVEKDQGRWVAYMDVITKIPDGSLYRWEFEEGLTEEQEPLGPNEYGEPQVTEVEEIERVTVVKEYFPVKR